ncbi:MAG: homoserine O-acetyltransferase [Candidatus Omnitrophica bacterium]|jgi:homoserine O-acetyltransferase|nr:homoserine O-acetyltransferase [Candidatus Omnitrophota bacterium]
MENKTSTEIVKKQYFTFAHPPKEIILESGEKLGPITLAYETYGKLNKNRNNAILVVHALSGDSHAAGFYENDKKPGWWEDMIGKTRALDTDKYFIICSNIIGGCGESTGPSTINPKTNKPYALDFPIITIGDMVNAQKFLIDYLGIDKLLCVIGGSMGGMQTLQWVALYPEKVLSAIPIATTLKHSPQQIAFNEVGRQAIMSDPAWLNGNYYGHSGPKKGLAVARMVGHITYMSTISMEEKFSRRLKEKTNIFPSDKFSIDFEVENYLEYRGDNFAKRFDANSYLYITKALDYFDLSEEKFTQKNKNIKTKFLIIAFKSDWLYPPSQSREIVKLLKINGIPASYCEIDSSYGHDAFLVEIEKQSELIKHFLNSVVRENNIYI